MPVPKVKVRKKPQNKRCEKGFPCKTTCISRAKNCLAPLNGQAATVTLWLAHQEEMLAIANRKRQKAGLTPARMTEYGYITAERTKLPQQETAKVEKASPSPFPSKPTATTRDQLVAEENRLGKELDAILNKYPGRRTDEQKAEIKAKESEYFAASRALRNFNGGKSIESPVIAEVKPAIDAKSEAAIADNADISLQDKIDYENLRLVLPGKPRQAFLELSDENQKKVSQLSKEYADIKARQSSENRNSGWRRTSYAQEKRNRQYEKRTGEIREEVRSIFSGTKPAIAVPSKTEIVGTILKVGAKQIDLPKPLSSYSNLNLSHDPSLGWQVTDKDGDVLRQPKTNGQVSSHRFKERSQAENFAKTVMAKVDRAIAKQKKSAKPEPVKATQSQKEEKAALEDLAKIRVDDTPKTTGGNSDRATNRLLNDLHQKAFEIKNAEATLLKMQKANDSIKARADKGSTTPPAFSSSEINKQKKFIKTAEDQYRALEVELQNSTRPIPQKRESRFKIPQSQAMRAKKPFERYRPNQVTDVPISILNFDPKRFQYKLVHGETGSSGSLTGVGKWNPNLAGVVQVWKDPSDNKIYVVNGHNRASLAKKLGVEKITVRFLDVPSAAAARATGALTNIAEGRGNALDAGKFFRDSGLSRQDLAKEGIPMKEAIAVQGLALATLPEHLFARVVLGEMSVARAAELGCCGLSHHQMDSLSQLIEQSEKKGKIITNAAIAELVETVKSSDTQKVEIFDLFGNSAQDQSLAIEKASLQSKMKSRLSREKKLFGTVGKTKAAKELERGGNQINKEESAKIAEEADIGLRIFDQLKNVSSPISDLLNEAARRITNGESRSKTEDEIYSRIIAVLPTLNVGGESFGSNGTKKGDGAIDDQPTLFSEYRHYTSDTRRTISQR